MQVYQVPQFLDSGNKILGPLTVFQLIYAMVGGGICFLIFNFLTALAPNLGIFALIPISPIAALTAYLAIGKYNGRDADIYVLKMILHIVKPRRMTYVRQPDLSELDDQIKELTPEKILERWREKRMMEQGEDIFRRQDTEYKISVIKNLSNSIETIKQNMLYETYTMEKKKESTERLIEQLQNTKIPNLPTVQKPIEYLENQINLQNIQQQESLNFLDLNKNKNG